MPTAGLISPHQRLKSVAIGVIRGFTFFASFAPFASFALNKSVKIREIIPVLWYTNSGWKVAGNDVVSCRSKRNFRFKSGSLVQCLQHPRRLKGSVEIRVNLWQKKIVTTWNLDKTFFFGLLNGNETKGICCAQIARGNKAVFSSKTENYETNPFGKIGKHRP